MSDIEKVVSCTRRLERLLREKYYAQGQGLMELVQSCEQRLPHSIIKKIHHVADIRQKVVHDDDYQLDDPIAFERMCLECEKELTPRSGRFIWGVAIILVLAMTIGAIVFYNIHWDVIEPHLPR
ncbi:MAG: DUF4145 domain-containing protein [Vibrio hibernica]